MELESLFRKKALQESHKHNITLSVYQSPFEALFEMSKELGSIAIKHHKDGIQITIGKYIVAISQHLEFFEIAFDDIHELSIEQAQVLATITKALSHKSYTRLHLQAPMRYEEKLLWIAAIKSKLDVKPQDNSQSDFFARWREQAQRKNLKTLTQEVTQTQAHSSLDPHKACFLSDGTKFQLLIDFIKEYGELNFVFKDGQLHFELDGLSFFIEIANGYLCINLPNISTLEMGAAALMAKLTEAFFYHREARVRLKGLGSNQELQRMWVAALEKGIFIAPTSEKERLLYRHIIELRSRQFDKLSHQNLNAISLQDPSAGNYSL